MFKSFLLVSLRNLKKNKGAINISLLGLLIGLTASQFIFNYLYHEMTYDHHLSSKIYRIEKHRLRNDEVIYKNALTAFRQAPDEVKNNPATESFFRLKQFGKSRKVFVNFHSQKDYTAKIRLEGVYFADSSIFDFIPFSFSQVNQSQLKSANTIMISESSARKIFTAKLSDIDIVNDAYFISRISKVDSTKLRIVAIYEDFPANTHLRPGAVASMVSFENQQNSGNLSNEEVYSYVKLNGMAEGEAFYGSKTTQNSSSEYDETLYFRPVQEIHTAVGISNEPEPGVDANLIFLLLVIGSIIMILADANYINNTILNSVDRMKEVGLRKLLGAGEKQVFTNIMTEFLFFNLLTGLLSFALYQLLANLIRIYAEEPVIFLEGNHLQEQLLFMLLVVILNAVLCGLYPAFHQLATKPIEALYGLRSAFNLNKFRSGFRVVNVLIVFQLIVSISFLSAVYIFYEQMVFQKEGKKPPYEFEVEGIFPGQSGVNNVFTDESNRFIQEQFDAGKITRLSISNLVEGKIHTSNNLARLLLADQELDTIKGDFYFAIIDAGLWKDRKDYIVAGSGFNREFNRDSEGLLVNESAVKAMGEVVADSILGKKIKLNVKGRYLTVKGVVKDDVENPVPSIYATGYGYPTFMKLRLNYDGEANHTISEFIRRFERTWSRHFTSFYFLDDEFALEDAQNSELFSLFLVFSVLALIIANLGLYGLTNFIVRKKQKEISLRKIMGADLHQILLILITDLMKVLLIAAVISVPLIIYLANEWLSNFYFRIDLRVIYILYPLLLTFAVALIVVAKNSFNAAVINPAETLKEVQ
ncbi:MAG: FtsX-like permease family protein [Bacteroidota bacterium]